MSDDGMPGEWRDEIASWGRSVQEVRAIFAFGSRVKGGWRPDSDLDLALDVDGADYGERLGNAIFLQDEWRSQLMSRLPVEVHLQCMMPDDRVVSPAVIEHGLLLYRREDQ